MIESDTIGAATVGLGVGEQHARALASCPGCTLRWVYDVDADKARRLAHDLGARAASQLDDILDDRGVALVTIASYDDAHAEQAKAALDAGKHVFVEKPLCRSHEELRQLERAWSDGGARLHLESNLILRAAPVYQWLQHAVAAGELGDVFAFDGDYLYGRLEKITDGWRGQVDGYSVVQGGAVHLIDLMLWITGERPTRVSAVGNRIASRGSAFRYDDYVSATYTFDSGIVGRITANFGCVHRHQHVVRVFGTRGTFVYDDCGPRLYRTRRDDAVATPIDLAAHAASKGDLIGPFVDRIASGADPVPAARREFDTMFVCFAADEALRTGGSLEVCYR